MIQTAPDIGSRPARPPWPLASVLSPENRIPALMAALVFLVVMGVYWVTISPTAITAAVTSQIQRQVSLSMCSVPSIATNSTGWEELGSGRGGDPDVRARVV